MFGGFSSPCAFDSLATGLVLVVFVVACSETTLLSTFLLLFSKCVHNISFISKSCFSMLFILITSLLTLFAMFAEGDCDSVLEEINLLSQCLAYFALSNFFA